MGIRNNVVRTPDDLERKYNLSNLSGLSQVVKSNTTQVNKLNNSLAKFVEKTTDDIENLQSQIDGNITTWFYSGEPTLENEPAVEWTTIEEQTNHIGDLYYDKETGYCYRWTLDSETNVFSWIKLADADITEALSVANAAKDTADSKRRVFVVTPTTPYDVGDLWITSSQELMRCKLGRTSEEEYDSSDWIVATKYVDSDSVANAISVYDTTTAETKYETQADFIKEKGAIELRVSNVETSKNTTFTSTPTTPYQVGDTYVKEVVHDEGLDTEYTDYLLYVCQVARTEEEEYNENDFSLQPTYATQNSLKVESDRILAQTISTAQYSEDIGKIQTKLGDIDTISGNVYEIQKSVQTLQDNDEIVMNFRTDVLENGVSKVTTETGYTFDSNGLHISDSTSDISSTLDNEGLEIIDKSGSSNEQLFYAGVGDNGESVVNTKNINIDKYLVMDKWRMEEVTDSTYGTGIGFFYLG